ncbi:MAG: PspC domain-containing protein [Mediterranea sp.]|jgi:phage shock protein PspC (stress-responsive transcriptional regulator)|nr:PspC domain-containing protein [Mediterranea sp.]
MKKTLTVNLGGTVYHIDEDAYQLLDNYLANLKSFFRRQEGADEIVADMETRIAELFAEKITAGKQVITIADVEEVIARVGKPEEFELADDGTSASSTGQDRRREEQAKQEEQARPKRNLYRDPDHKALGGVAAGLAAYFGWDMAWTRVVMVILLFIPYCPMLLLYLILWIVIPEAHTATEKLNMRGEPVTVENIGKTVTDNFEQVSGRVNDYVNSGKPRSFLQSVGDVLLTIVTVIFKVLVVALIIICCPALFAAVLGLLVMVAAILAVLLGGSTAVVQGLIPSFINLSVGSVSPVWGALGVIAILLTICIPLGAFLHTLLRQLFHWQPMNAGARVTLLVLWLIALLGAIYYFFQFVMPYA